MNSNPVILEYVWLDGKSNLRSKYKTVYTNNLSDFSINDVPTWNYDGSSTGQATTENSEIILVPSSIYKNPFFQETPFFQNNNSYLVLCSTYSIINDMMIPTATNHRHNANIIFSNNLNMEPWFGIEQEYFMMKNNIPPFFEEEKIKDQGDYYCGVGSKNIMYRELAEKHYKYCLYAQIKISGINAEVAPNQWEYQIGPCTGIMAGDMHWMSRYILCKLAEEYNISISFEPKPLNSPWNGSGLHTNFSTNETRNSNGMDVINEMMTKLSCVHKEHIAVYGDNSKRLCGECETSDINKFTCGYGNRGCSIRIPTDTIKNNCGYFEDRRPASDADPYIVTSILFKTCCL